MDPFLALDPDDPAPQTPFVPEGDGMYFIWSSNRGEWSYLFAPRPEYDIWKRAAGFTTGYTALLVFEKCAFVPSASWPEETPLPELPFSAPERREGDYFVFRSPLDPRPGPRVLGRYTAFEEASIAAQDAARRLAVDCVVGRLIYVIPHH